MRDMLSREPIIIVEAVLKLSINSRRGVKLCLRELLNPAYTRL
jgi:hypothetical protein